MTDSNKKRPIHYIKAKAKNLSAKSRARIKTTMTVLLIIFMAMVITGATVIFYTFGVLDNSIDSTLDSLYLNQSSILYYYDKPNDQWLQEESLFSGTDRTWVSLSQIPEAMQNAAIAIEDKRFRKHSGVDFKRTMGAIYALATGQTRYGGSTITQQLVKNLTQEDAVSMKRKLQEIARALKLEKEYTKDQILEFYLNTIFLGENCNGVQSAAQTYFGKNASELTLAECASIIGITQFPGKYDPLINPDYNKQKQEIVLNEMYNQHMISKEERDQAIAQKLVFKSGKVVSDKASTQSYYTDQVIEDVIADLQEKYGYNRKIASSLIYSGGLKIYTAMDKNVQDAMDSVFVNNSSFPTVVGSKQPEAAMTVIDPHTGAVLGMVGGKGQKTGARTLNRSTQTTRPPGSAIKPVAVYAPALENNVITEGSVFDDTPFDIEGRYPKNYTRTYTGLKSVKQAVAESNNAVPVRILDKLGFDKSYKFLTENLHVTSLVKRLVGSGGTVSSDLNYGPLALGGLTKGISVQELTAAYVPFANGGIYYTPYTYTKVVDGKGNVLLEKAADPSVAMREQVAYIMNDLLQGVVTNGTGAAAKIANQPTAGKTGTTSDDFDRWYVGYTPYYVGTVWYGFDTNKTIVTTKGMNPALSIWKQVMTKVHQNKQRAEFYGTSNIVTAEYCLDSGLKPTEICKADIRGDRTDTAIYEKGTEPTEECNVHVWAKICTESGQIAGPYCTSTKMVGLINFRREFPYNIEIRDAQYTYLPLASGAKLTPGEQMPVYISMLPPGITPGYSAGAEFPVNNCCHIHTGPSDETGAQTPSDTNETGGTAEGNTAGGTIPVIDQNH